MTTSSHAANRQLAAALKSQAKRTGEQTPSVRGSDWRLATVTAENNDGTVTADDITGIRCMETYTQPRAGDLIVITQSSSGNWLALGRTTTVDPDWTPLTLAAGFQNPGHGYTASYLREGRRIYLRGRIGPTSGTIANNATLLTLPAAIQPAAVCAWAVVRDASVVPAVCRLEISLTGIVQTFQSSNLPTWVGLDGISYTI